MRHIVNYSGGAGSYAAAKRVCERYGSENVTLLCADTLSEADDWRDFVNESAAVLGAELVMLTHGLDVWQLADQQRAIPSSRMGFCTRILKREPMDAWREQHCEPDDTVIYLGFDWTEGHRLERAKTAMKPWKVEAPLMWQPILDKAECLTMIRTDGLPFPTAYDLGLPHNNCLKFGCVKGGIRYWARLLDVLPDTFARTEALEADMRAKVGDHAMLSDRRGGTRVPMPLSRLRERVESGEKLAGDWGACGCTEY